MEKGKVPSTMTTQRVKNKQKYFRKIAKTFLNTGEEQNF